MYRIKADDMSPREGLKHGGREVLEPWLQEDIAKFAKD